MPLDLSELGVFRDALPRLLCRSAHDSEDLADLMVLVPSLKETVLTGQFSHDAAGSPDIDGSRVLVDFEK